MNYDEKKNYKTNANLQQEKQASRGKNCFLRKFLFFFHLGNKSTIVCIFFGEPSPGEHNVEISDNAIMLSIVLMKKSVIKKTSLTGCAFVRKIRVMKCT